MYKVLLSFFILSSPVFAANFECKSEIDALVADDIQDRAQIVITGEISANLELKNVSFKLTDIPARESFFWDLQPRETGTVNYHFSDDRDYHYELRFPKNVGQSPFKSEVSIYLETFSSTVALDCQVRQ